MANTNAPFGLRFLGLQGGPPTNSALKERRNGILSTNTTPIFTGDLIKMSANGFLYQWTAGAGALTMQGVFAGCRYASNSQQTVVPQKYYPGTDAASGSILAQYYQGALATPGLFVIQSDSTGVTAGSIGLNADIVVGSGSTITGFSASILDSTTISTTATLPLRIVDLWVNYAMGNNPEGVGGASALSPGTQSGGFNWVVVALNNYAQQGT